MAKDLTNSIVERKNILNNNMAIKAIYDNIGFNGILFEGKYRFTKNQISQFYDVDARTIDRLLENNNKELQDNGYEVFTGNRLKQFKESFSIFLEKNKDNINLLFQFFESEFKKLNKTSVLATFTFRTFLNVGMLLKNSAKAQWLRTYILDLVLDSLNKKLVGSTNSNMDRLKNQLENLPYAENFRIAIDKYIDFNNFNYYQLTNRILKNIFNENADNYKHILKIRNNENDNKTYSEIIDLISSYESGFAVYLEKEFIKKKRKLSILEAHDLFSKFENSIDAFVEPLRNKVKVSIHSNNYNFRDIINKKIDNNLKENLHSESNKYLSIHIIDFEQRLEENKDVFKRLKDR